MTVRLRVSRVRVRAVAALRKKRRGGGRGGGTNGDMGRGRRERKDEGTTGKEGGGGRSRFTGERGRSTARGGIAVEAVMRRIRN